MRAGIIPNSAVVCANIRPLVMKSDRCRICRCRGRLGTIDNSPVKYSTSRSLQIKVNSSFVRPPRSSPRSPRKETFIDLVHSCVSSLYQRITSGNTLSLWTVNSREDTNSNELSWANAATTEIHDETNIISMINPPFSQIVLNYYCWSNSKSFISLSTSYKYLIIIDTYQMNRATTKHSSSTT